MRLRTVLAFWMCLLPAFWALSISSCSTDEGGGQPFSQDVQDKLNQAVNDKMAEFGVPGGHSRRLDSRQGRMDFVQGCRQHPDGYGANHP